MTQFSCRMQLVPKHRKEKNILAAHLICLLCQKYLCHLVKIRRISLPKPLCPTKPRKCVFSYLGKSQCLGTLLGKDGQTRSFTGHSKGRPCNARAQVARFDLTLLLLQFLQCHRELRLVLQPDIILTDLV